MGFHISWIGFNGVRKADVLDVAGLYDTGEPDEALEEPFCCAELPTGWTILWANDPTYAEDQIKTLSANHAALSCIIMESAMISVAAFHVRGELLWNVSHEGNLSVPTLILTGAVPPQTTTLREEMLAKQKIEDEKLPEHKAGFLGVDYVFEVPVMLAKSICGFRYDQGRYEWGEPAFTVAARRTR